MSAVPPTLAGTFIDRPFSANKSALAEMPFSASGDNSRARMGRGTAAVDTRNVWGMQNMHDPFMNPSRFSGGWHGDFLEKAPSTHELCNLVGVHSEAEQSSNFSFGVDSKGARLGETQAPGLGLTCRPNSDCASLGGAFSPVTIMPPRYSWPREAPEETTLLHATGQNAPLSPSTKEEGRRGLALDWSNQGRQEGLTIADSAGFKNQSTAVDRQIPDVGWREPDAREQESVWAETCGEKELADPRQIRRRCETETNVEDDRPRGLLLGTMGSNPPDADVPSGACAPQSEDLENDANASSFIEVRAMEYSGCH